LVDSASVKIRCLADLGQGQAGGSRLLEALAPRNSGLVSLALSALNLGLRAPHIGASLLLWIVRHFAQAYSPKHETSTRRDLQISKPRPHLSFNETPIQHQSAAEHQGSPDSPQTANSTTPHALSLSQ
jgi:hypothetical protein